MDAITRKLDQEILSLIKRPWESAGSERDFKTLALKLFGYQFKLNAAYRVFCLLQNQSPKNVKRWKDIPAMPAAGFKELALATFPIKHAAKVFRTSGTTQTGQGAHYFDSLKLYEKAIAPTFKRYLMPDRDKFSFFFLTHSPKEAPDSSLSHMMSVVNHVFAGGRGKYYVNNDGIQFKSLVDDLKAANQSALILSTAFSLKNFLDTLGNKKISLKLPGGSRLMETGGFKGKVKSVSKDELYSHCAKRLGILEDHCVSEYGMTELSSQFYDTTLVDKMNQLNRKPFKQGPAWVRTLVIDPKTGKEAKNGESGLLRHFDLANRGSVLAIQTEDVGRQVDDGFELMGRAKGSEVRGCSLTYEELLSVSTR